MTPGELLPFAALVFAVAALYSMVGHAGASGYLAVMALYGFAPQVMKPAALMLNIVVATVATVQFARAGRFSWRVLWPFAVTSIPLAFLGGSIALPSPLYKRILGAVLVYAAVRLFMRPGVGRSSQPRAVPRPLALVLGAAIGFLSGLTGVGGGIFLSPLLLLARWADAPVTAGVSAAFILANSAAGLLGHVGSVRFLPRESGLLVAVAAAGGLLGSTVGSRRLPPLALRRALAVVLVIAAGKLFLV